jgi:glutamyl-tRNA synthetase
LPVRVRFAPSPTGYLHVGGARTALFNWLFARHEKGVFVLRVEDTDMDRNRPELVEGIPDSLKWLGLGWDEGPYFQSERLQSYREFAQRLLQSGHAYYCYCTTGEMEAKRKVAEQARPAADGAGKPWKYDRTCRRLSPAEQNSLQATGRERAVRFRVPEEGKTSFEDLVYGHVEVDHSEIEDFVLLRSDGLPTYHLGVVTDDLAMKITHVIRGADHISNTPKQVLMYRALRETPPLFAHVPLILGPDRTRLSKRHGATSVTSYMEEGFLPEAFVNFLALLGWSPGDNTEILSTDELIERFSLAAVSRTNAVFNREKLEWFNSQYLQHLPVERVAAAVEQELRAAGLWQEEFSRLRRAWFEKTVDLLRSRTRSLKDFSTWGRAFWTDDFSYDQAAVDKFLKDPQLCRMMKELATGLAALDDFRHETAEAVLRGLAEREGVKAALLINAARVGLTGRAVAPPLFETMVALGKERVVSRLEKLVRFLSGRS